MRKRKTVDVSVREAALMLCKRLDDTYKLVQVGRLKGRKVDGRWLVSAASVEACKQAAKDRRMRLIRKAGRAPAPVTAPVSTAVAPAEARV